MKIDVGGLKESLVTPSYTQQNTGVMVLGVKRISITKLFQIGHVDARDYQQKF